MKHEKAFEPWLATTGLLEDELDRLPWLMDEPRRVRRRLSTKLLAFGIALTVGDAVASYAAGVRSVHHEWFAEPGAATDAVQVRGPTDAMALVQGISPPPNIGWVRRRPSAPY